MKTKWPRDVKKELMLMLNTARKRINLLILLESALPRRTSETILQSLKRSTPRLFSRSKDKSGKKSKRNRRCSPKPAQVFPKA